MDVVNNTVKKDIRIKLLNFFPLLKIKKRRNKLSLLLFNFLPILTIQKYKYLKIVFLLGIIPIFFLINKEPLFYYISIGDNCACAHYLNLYGLRDFSSPFDWIAINNTSKTLFIVAERFKNFFNKEDFIYSGNEGSMDAYFNKFAQYTSYHDFPKGLFEKSFENVERKYRRRIKRFCNILDNYNNVLIRTKYFSDEIIDKQKILELCEKINNTYKKKQYFVFFEHIESMQENELNFVRLSDNVLIVQCFCYNKNAKCGDAIYWLGNQVACNKFFSLLKPDTKNNLFY